MAPPRVRHHQRDPAKFGDVLGEVKETFRRVKRVKEEATRAAQRRAAGLPRQHSDYSPPEAVVQHMTERLSYNRAANRAKPGMSVKAEHENRLYHLQRRVKEYPNPHTRAKNPMDPIAHPVRLRRRRSDDDLSFATGSGMPQYVAPAVSPTPARALVGKHSKSTPQFQPPSRSPSQRSLRAAGRAPASERRPHTAEGASPRRRGDVWLQPDEDFISDEEGHVRQLSSRSSSPRSSPRLSERDSSRQARQPRREPDPRAVAMMQGKVPVFTTAATREAAYTRIGHQRVHAGGGRRRPERHISDSEGDKSEDDGPRGWSRQRRSSHGEALPHGRRRQGQRRNEKTALELHASKTRKLRTGQRVRRRRTTRSPRKADTVAAPPRDSPRDEVRDTSSRPSKLRPSTAPPSSAGEGALAPAVDKRSPRSEPVSTARGRETVSSGDAQPRTGGAVRSGQERLDDVGVPVTVESDGQGSGADDKDEPKSDASHGSGVPGSSASSADGSGAAGGSGSGDSGVDDVTAAKSGTGTSVPTEFGSKPRLRFTSDVHELRRQMLAQIVHFRMFREEELVAFMDFAYRATDAPRRNVDIMLRELRIELELESDDESDTAAAALAF